MVGTWPTPPQTRPLPPSRHDNNHNHRGYRPRWHSLHPLCPVDLHFHWQACLHSTWCTHSMANRVALWHVGAFNVTRLSPPLDAHQTRLRSVPQVDESEWWQWQRSACAKEKNSIKYDTLRDVCNNVFEKMSNSSIRTDRDHTVWLHVCLTWPLDSTPWLAGLDGGTPKKCRGW